MFAKLLIKFVLFLALFSLHFSVKAQLLPFPFGPAETTQDCQALFYPESGLLEVPCLVIESDMATSYEVHLRLGQTRSGAGFLIEEVLNGQVDVQLADNAACLSRYMPRSGELSMPCLNVPGAIDLGYSALLQLNPTATGGFFSVNSIENRLAPASPPETVEPTPVEAESEPTPEPTPVQPAVSPLTVQIMFKGTGQGTVIAGNQVCQQNCTVSIAEGEAMQLRAAPAANSAFIGWGGCSTSSDKSLCYLQWISMPNNTLSLTVEFQPATQEAHAVLLLHGMNSDELTWNDYLDQHDQFHVGNCPVVFDGVLTDPYVLSARTTPPELGCFRVRFGAHDATSGRIGLENIRANGPEKGDYATFDQLGQEVADAVTALQQAYQRYYGENVVLKVALVGHSRGGLAARAFLQNDTTGQEAKAAVAALLTTGTPHNGSPLGRIYGYLRQSCLSNNTVRLGEDGWFSNDPCFDDWQVVDTVRSGKCNGIDAADDRLDVRKPTIADLSDNSTAISNLHLNANKLPNAIRYGSLRYSGVELGRLAENYRIFDLADIDWCDQVSTNAQYAVLEGSAPTGSHLIGDGVVPYVNQDFPTGIATYDKNPKNGVFHTKEPKEEIHISDALNMLLPHWY